MHIIRRVCNDEAILNYITIPSYGMGERPPNNAKDVCWTMLYIEALENGLGHGCLCVGTEESADDERERYL